MATTDLRAWIEDARKFGELREICGADWNLEIGGITELAFKGYTDRPAIIFDQIKDYPKGYRVLMNVQCDKDVNLYKFPAPHWHEHDGGRYIGTAGISITRDPDEGSVNFGVYRVVIHDENTLGFYISPGKHGRVYREKYYSRAIIEACRPYEWIDKFPRTVETSPELKEIIIKKWGAIISS